MSLIEHLAELRKRLIVSALGLLLASIAGFLLYPLVLELLMDPLRTVEAAVSGGGESGAGGAAGGGSGVRGGGAGPGGAPTLFVHTLFEGFLTRLKLALLTGLVLSAPLHVFNAAGFVFPGLTGREKRVVGLAVLGSFFLALAAFAYGYFRIIPLSISFLTGSGFIPEQVGLLLNYSTNIFYVTQFLLVCVLLFQLPIVLVALMAVGVVKQRHLWRSMRYIVVGTFLLAAILTPPDFISQLSVAVPLIVLFVLAGLLAKLFGLGAE
jgi:sec-independent protein translocase protein TatC